MDKKKSKNKKVLSDEPTKQDYSISKYMRFKGPSKKANMFGSKVQYFTASKMVDALMSSKWALNGKTPALFLTREDCVDFLNLLLIKNFFHRVRKFVKILELSDKEVDNNEKEEKSKKKAAASLKESIHVPRSTLANEDQAQDEASNTASDNNNNNQKDYDSQNTKANLRKRKKKEKEKEEIVTKKKEKKKVKLELHEIQEFIDGTEEYYVWVYDPVPLKTWILGFCIVIGAIVVCLFPLWPVAMRTGVYYLSLAGAGFLGLILFLALLRYVIFGIVWALTCGRVHIWFLPNLLEDVGFVESFIPVYTLKSSLNATSTKKQHKSKSSKDKTTKKSEASKKLGETASTKKSDAKAGNIENKNNSIKDEKVAINETENGHTNNNNNNNDNDFINLDSSQSTSTGHKSHHSLQEDTNKLTPVTTDDFELINGLGESNGEGLPLKD